MKKYQSNKAKKILLASLAIPVIVSVLPSEMVNANNIPTLNVYDLNGNPKLEWSTEILQENILTKINFDDNQLPSLTYYNHLDSLHSISTAGGHTGKGYLLNDNSNGKGNYYNFPDKSSDKHLSNYGKFNFENGIPLSMTFKAKSMGTSVITPWGNGGYANSLKPLKNKLTKAYKAGETVLQVDSVDGLTVGYEITSDTDPNQIKEIRQIVAVNPTNKTITLNSSFSVPIKVGENLKVREWRYVFDFNSRTINDEDWKTYSINTLVNDYEDYDVATRGAVLYLTTQTNGKLMIDDVTFGHATEVEVYRNQKSIYKGYMSDFYDTEVVYDMKPNNVKEINTYLKDKSLLTITPVKPLDYEAVNNYTIQAIAKDKTRTNLSEDVKYSKTSEVVKYKYEVTKSENTSNNLTNTTDGFEFDLALNQLNFETDYIHIQSVDSYGNESEIKSFKLKDIVNVSDLNDLYNKLKDVENSNDYNDFVDFIDEIEQLYGDNLPQDLKEMIDKLGKHHGVNTSFLLLEEGDFRLTTADIQDFGKVKLTAAKQTVVSDFLNGFGVIDARGTQEGWNVSVSATPFTVETFDGFMGTPHQLPVGSLALNAVNGIEQIGQVHNSQLPDITLNQYTAIDGQNATINLLDADKQKGMGEFQFTFGSDALALTVDAVTAKIDNVNYPDKNTPYASTVTWDLVSGPKI